MNTSRMHKGQAILRHAVHWRSARGREPCRYPFVLCGCVHVRTSGAISLCNIHSTHSITCEHVFCGRANKHNELHYPWGNLRLGCSLFCSCITHTPCDSQRKSGAIAGENSFVAPPNWNNMQGTANMKKKWRCENREMKKAWVSRCYIYVIPGYGGQWIKEDGVARKKIEVMFVYSEKCCSLKML